MFKIENHFGGDTTYFVGALCISGCQCFTLDEAPEVFDQFDVPEAMREDVYRNLPQPDWAMGDANSITRSDIAKHTATPPDVLALLAQDADVDVRRAVAFNKNTPLENIARLKGDEDWLVRHYVEINQWKTK